MKRININVTAFVFALWASFGPSALAGEMLDAEKKDIVYRMYENYKRNDFPEVQDVDAKRAQELYEEGKAIFVDIRTPKEMAVSQLPEAVSESEFLKRPEPEYTDKTIIAYCTISYRSGVFAQKMSKRGRKVHNLEGGLLAWIHEGGKVFHDGKETRRVHLYGEDWDYPPSGYESVVFSAWERWFGNGSVK